jgi:Flp pilus assembly protein TadD
VLGAALQASGDCKEASREFEKAIALDAADARAKSGRQDCAGK